jgi:hypothetical protein
MKSCIVLAALLLSIPAQAQEEDAQSIAKKALDSNVFATQNARAELELTVNKDGKPVRSRKLSTKIKRSEDGTVRTFIEFSTPVDVAGTKFLSIETKGSATEQYIYLPAFKKVKRVVGSQRSDSFMGTDFAYDDLDGRDPTQADWKKLPDAALGGQDCWVVEGISKNETDAYAKVIVWVHKKSSLPMRMDFYPRGKNEVEKRLTVKKLEKKEERWLATDSVMATLSKGTETRIALLAVDFNQAIPDDELTKAVLER